MVDQFLFDDLVLIALLWLGVIVSERWACNQVATGPIARTRDPPLPKHSQEPKPFAGLTHKPHCTACEQVPAPAEPFPFPPPLFSTPQGRPRRVEASQQFCPQPHCAY